MNAINKTIFCAGNSGGAFLVASRRAKAIESPLVVLKQTSLCAFLNHIRSSDLHYAEFHQPGSFIFAIIYAFVKGGGSARIWLHECSYYNLRLTAPATLLAWVFRLFLVRTLFAMGARLTPVSLYVKKSYFLTRSHVSKVATAHDIGISFTPKLLTESDLDELIVGGVAVLFLRPFANCKRTIRTFTRNINPLGVKKIIAIGSSPPDCFFQSVEIPVTWLGIVNRSIFLELISKSYVLVTPFKREGLGLSAIEAMLSGNIIICPNSGAYSEYVPSSNHCLGISHQGCNIPSAHLPQIMLENIDAATKFLSGDI